MMENQITVINGGVAVDDRGSVRFVNDFNFENVKRFYQVQNHRRGFIRAWHGHNNEGKYVYVASGSALVAAVPMNAREGDISAVSKYVLSDVSPKILFIPAGHYNGFMSLEENTRIIFFSTSTIEESKGDDIRKPYDCWNVWEEDFR